MSEKRLIDAGSLFQDIVDQIKTYKATPHNSMLRNRINGLDVARLMVDEAPTIAAVEVVRCQDCIHAKPVPAHAAKDFTDKALSCEAQRGDWKRAYGFSVVAAWGYCNEGERKEPDHE